MVNRGFPFRKLTLPERYLRRLRAAINRPDACTSVTAGLDRRQSAQSQPRKWAQARSAKGQSHAQRQPYRHRPLITFQ